MLALSVIPVMPAPLTAMAFSFTNPIPFKCLFIKDSPSLMLKIGMTVQIMGSVSSNGAS